MKSIKSALGASAEIYRNQKSALAVARYLARLISRRGPAAIRRRIEIVRSLGQVAEAAPRREGRLNVGALVQGAVGDNIIAARFLRDLSARCPNIIFDIYTVNVSLGQWIYSDVQGLGRCLQDASFARFSGQYDASLIFEDTVRLGNIRPDLENHDLGRFSEILDSMKRFQDEHPDFMGRYNRNGVLAEQLFYKHNTIRASAAHFIAGIEYGGDRYLLPVEDSAIADFSLSNQKYITVHNGFDLSQVTHSGTVTKVYPKFGEAIAEIRKERPELTFVQIGSSTSIAIEGIDLNLIGRTSLQQAASLVKGASCHIDNEGGLVSVASCFGTPCCVVFGPSSPDYLSYEGNIAVRPVECGGCWWITNDWLSRCPRGMTHPVCMYKQPPTAVAKATLQLLKTPKR
jgi:Glycosyltransferase family 9 (heptosyltransferase)